MKNYKYAKCCQNCVYYKTEHIEKEINGMINVYDDVCDIDKSYANCFCTCDLFKIRDFSYDDNNMKITSGNLICSDILNNETMGKFSTIIDMTVKPITGLIISSVGKLGIE